MALSTEEQRFYDFAKGALPPWVRDGDAFLHGAAKMFGSVKALSDYLFGQALISGATGATATTPDWLDQHARDRGTGRRAGEDTATLRERLRNTPDAVTRIALIEAIQAIVDAAGVAGDVAIVELPEHAAHFGSYDVMTGTGGTFAQVGTVSSFTPDDLPWPVHPYRDVSLVAARVYKLTIAGAANAANNGTRTITGLSGDAAQVTNGAGVAGGDATCTWTVTRFDGGGQQTDGYARAYLGRGYRMSQTRPGKIIVILPYGSDAGLEESVREALRQKKAAGVRGIVERRLIP